MATGIDCSKDYFDIVVLQDDNISFKGRFSNNKEGFETMLPHVLDSHVSMEATGPYYVQLALFLHHANIKISVINPLVIRRFTQMQMSRAKTDKKDALSIALFTLKMKPGEWVPPRKQVLELMHLDTYLEGLNIRRQMLSNQLHAFESAGTVHNELLDELSEGLSLYDSKIKNIGCEIDRRIKETYSELSENLRTIPGVGPRSTMLLIILTDGFGKFENYKQLISYFGLAPRIYESGNSVRGKSKICKMGMGRVRKVLYMAATSAIRCNKACQGLYERLRAKGKPHRVALIAAVNKLIKQAFAIAKSGKPYRVQLA